MFSEISEKSTEPCDANQQNNDLLFVDPCVTARCLQVILLCMANQNIN